LAFENYLNLVAQLYYKSTFQPANILPIFESNGQFANSEDQNLLISMKKPGKRGRKAKPKPQLQQAQENSEDLSILAPEASNRLDIESKDDLSKEDFKIQQDSTALAKIDIMDSLVSPLKADYVFEKWSPKEIAIFEAGLCKYGKEFSFIQFLVKTKNVNEIIQFYFAWKNTSHYKMWKHYKNIENKMNYNSWL